MNKPRILIAEDAPNLREVLRLQLTAAGYDVVEAPDGKEAVERAREAMPDLVLLDVMMPFMDGFEVCRRMRASFLTRHIPIIMLTAKSEVADKLEGLQGGANDYITKPWEARELMARVRNALEWSRQQRSASPLTGLPGNIAIDQELRHYLERGEPFVMLQLDIDSFKAFNDQYGYARGDLAIQTLASILVDNAQRRNRAAADGGADDFVGHIGGDDFLVLTRTERAESLADAIITDFTQASRKLYDDEDVARGYIEVPNRRHVPERFPFMSLTIALVSTERYSVTHQAELADIAHELKAHGKTIAGNVVIAERRARGDASDDARNVA